MRVKTQTQSPAAKTQSSFAAAEAGVSIGQNVVHQKFGAGVILSVEGSGAHTRVQVKFGNGETKWLVLAYANLAMDNEDLPF
jgi:DNA helicase-2/ATP-dependent DNA helicase PcrA